MKRMKVLELSKNKLPEKDLCNNIKTAVKGALYMYFRCLYNDVNITLSNEIMHCALFYFIRNYCYSGMFRYNDNGEFNVPSATAECMYEPEVFGRSKGGVFVISK